MNRAKTKLDPSHLVAHRGYAEKYPENTLIAIEAALKEGAKFIEIDIQMCADGIPVLFHDDDVSRVSNQTGNITDFTLEQISKLYVSEQEKFGDRFMNNPVTRLSEYIETLCQWPDVKSFIEIKPESLLKHGISTVMDKIIKDSTLISDNCIMISYDTGAMHYAREHGAHEIGVILKSYDDIESDDIRVLAPDYIFCNIKKIPESSSFTSGSWKWVIYEITDPILGKKLINKGAHMIETMKIADMLQL